MRSLTARSRLAGALGIEVTDLLREPPLDSTLNTTESPERPSREPLQHASGARARPCR